jgi:threonine/homoserine/homoserine lactone efflux protein
VTESLVAGLLAGWGIAIPVGAVATYLVTLTARTSPAVGGAGALGVATADGLYALLAVVGGAALTGLIAGIAGPLRWASAVVLVAVAAGIAWSAIRDHRAGRPGPTAGDRSMTPTRAYGTLLGITLLNPATVIYFSALVVGSKATGAPTAGQGAVFVLRIRRLRQLAAVIGGRWHGAGSGADRAARAADHRTRVKRADPGVDRGAAGRRLTVHNAARRGCRNGTWGMESARRRQRVCRTRHREPVPGRNLLGRPPAWDMLSEVIERVGCGR